MPSCDESVASRHGAIEQLRHVTAMLRGAQLIVASLAYQFGNKRILIGRPEETRRLMLRNEFGGVNEAFYNLYSITADKRHKECTTAPTHFYPRGCALSAAPEKR